MDKGLVIGIIVVILLLLTGWALYAYYYTATNPANEQEQETTQGAKGTLYFSVTDAAVNMQNISAVSMTVDKAYAHSATQGWVQVASNPQTFDLLKLKADGKAEMYARMDVVAGAYDQVWFHITNVTVTESGKAKTAALPSGDVKVTANVKVQEGRNSVVKLDVFADQSLHKTSKGEFIFAPTVNVESKSDVSVNVNSANAITVSGGAVDANVNAGMDVDGTVKVNFKLDLNANLQIDNGAIKL